MSSIYSIYRCTNTTNGKIYIGFDSNWPKRKNKHLYDYKNPNSKNYNCHFYRAIRKFGIDNFEWDIVYQSTNKEHCLSIMEPHFIKEYKSFVNGYNMTEGGEGTFGKTSWLGKTHSDETKNKISQSLKGKIRNQEHSLNISKSTKGKKRKPFTEEHKRKLSESHKRRKLTANLV
jgi:group I intron endonuclease